MADLPDILNQSVLRAGEDTNTYTSDTSSSKGIQYVFVNMDSFNPSFNIPPTRNAVIIYEQQESQDDSKHYTIELLRFGLVPSWALPKDPTPTAHGLEYSREVNALSSKFFNCRKETFAQHSPVWMGVKNNRCVVPIQGYYEWKKEGKNKVPHFVHSKTSPIIYLAGMYSHNTNFKHTELSTNEKYLSSFTVITGPATATDTKDMSWLHARKPLMLLPGTREWNEWLNPLKQWDDSMFDTCLETKKNKAYMDIEIYPVSKDIGRTSSQGEYLMRREDPPPVKKQKDISLFFLSPKGKKTVSSPDVSELQSINSKLDSVKKEKKDISLFFLPSKKRPLDGDNSPTKRIKTEPD